MPSSNYFKSAKVEFFMTKLGAEELAEGICRMEGVKCVTFSVLYNLGMGTDCGMRLADCDTPKKKAQVRSEIATTLLSMDSTLLKLGHSSTGDVNELKRSALLGLTRLAGTVVEAIVTRNQAKAAAVVGAGAGGTPARAGDGGNVNYVVTQSEEERGFTVPDYGNDTVKKQKELVAAIYNLVIRPSHLPGTGGMKKVAYWVTKEGVWPDPVRVPLSAMRVDKSDSEYTLFRRLALAVVTVAAGEGVSAGLRDEGAGYVDGYAPQWANAAVFLELINELDEVRDSISDSVMGAICAVMHATMHKATSRAKETASLAGSRQVSKVAEYVTQHQLALGKQSSSAPAPSSASNKRKRKPAAPGGGGGQSGGGSGNAKGAGAGSGGNKVAKKKWEDKAGEKGPNGLDRMAGGNPAGAKCTRHASAGGCPFATCSFSHA